MCTDTNKKYLDKNQRLSNVGSFLKKCSSMLQPRVLYEHKQLIFIKKKLFISFSE